MATAVDISHHLQCPICKNLYEDPVTTSCGHTVCKRCLDRHISMSDPQCPLCEEPVSTKPSVNTADEALLLQFLQAQMPGLNLYTGERGEIPCDVCEINLKYKAVKSCLTCLISYCERHLQQHGSLERFRSHNLVSPVEKLDERACRVHGRPLELYCEENKRCICVLCVTTGVDAIPVKMEREKRKVKQQNTIKELESVINQRENQFTDLQNSCQGQIDREQREIREVFAEVMDLVKRAEEELFAPLEDGRWCLMKEMEEKAQEIQNDTRKNKETVDHLKKIENEEDDFLFLQSYPTVPADFQHNWTVSIDTNLNFGSVRKVKSSLLASIKTRLENLCSFDIRRIQRFSVDLILDKETAHPRLEVFQDGKAVKDSGDVHAIPGSPKQFDLVGGILGNLQIKSGRAFWVVEVGQKPGWELGVMRENANRRGKLSYKPSDGYWAIVLIMPNTYGAFEDPPIQLNLSTNPQKVGVFVDYEEALVSFYNMTDQSHIYTFTECRFNGTIRPYFNPHPNTDGHNSHPMIICSVSPTDQSN